MLRHSCLALMLLLRSQCATAAGLHDRYGLFCGVGSDCYDVLGLTRNASRREINKAYRGLSVTHHPDKGGDPKLFRAIAQAHEVLTTDERRESLDYYLKRPSEYWKAYGDYINYTYAPKTDWKLVVLMILLFLSVITHFYQLTLHNQQVASVRKAVMQNLGVGQGGSRETLALRKRALELLEKGQSAKDAKKSKRNNNDQFVKIVDELIDEMQLQKPSFWDMPIIWVFVTPATAAHNVAVKGKIMYNHRVKGGELSDEDKVFLIKSNLPRSLPYDMLSQEEKKELFDAGAWEKQKCAEWCEGIEDDVPSSPSKKAANPNKMKRELRLRKNTKGERFTSGPE